MKKVLKFLCLLLIAALIAILVLKNGVNADTGSATIIPRKTSDITSGETITVEIDFSSYGEIQSYDGVVRVDGVDGDNITAATAPFSGNNSSTTVELTVEGSGTGVISISGTITTSDGTVDIQGNSVTITMKSDEPVQRSITIEADGSTTLAPKQTVTLTAKDENGDPIGVGWSSNDQSIASLDGNGNSTVTVTANSAGEASITARGNSGEYMGIFASVTITVQGEEPPPPPSDPLTVTASQGTIYVREGSTTVTANKDVEWLIEGDAATLDNRQARSVTVTPVHEGSVTVTGKAGEEIQGVTITVAKRETPPDDDPQPNLTPGKTTLTIGEDQSTTITSDIDIENWSSSDRNVAVVAADSTARQATILPKNAGTTTITATTSKGKFAIVTITVKKNEYAAPVITPSTPSGNIKMEVGTSVSLSANQNVSWSSGNSSIAAVGSSGVVVAKGVGETRITATNTNGKSSSVTITVIQTSNNGGGNNGDGGNGSVTNPDDVNPDVGTVTTTTFAISPTKTQTLNIGDTLQIKVTKGSATSWKSSKPAVASVDNNGKVTANSAGTTIITAVSSDGSVAQVKVRVRDENGEVPDPGSESNNDVPSTGEASTELLLVLGVLTCVIAMFIFRKKTK